MIEHSTYRLLQAVPDEGRTDEGIILMADRCRQEVVWAMTTKGNITDLDIAYILKKNGFHFELFEHYFDLVDLDWRIKQLTDRGKNGNSDH